MKEVRIEGEKERDGSEREEIEIDIARAQARLRQELLRYRKLLQTRDFMQDNASEDALETVRERLRESQRHVLLLEKALACGRMARKDAEL